MSKYTEGICGDGVAILCDGQPLTISEILRRLNAPTTAPSEVERLAVEIADAVSRLKAVEAGHYGNGWFNWSLYADLKWPNYLESRGLLEHHPTRPELVRVKGESDGNV